MTASQSPETEELLERATRGDQQAIEQLLTRYRPRLRQMVMVRMDPRLKSRIDPSDVVQEALMDASRMLSEYLRARPLPYYPWLRQVAWQRLYDLHVQHVQAKKRSVVREGVDVLMLSDALIVQLAERVVAAGTSPSMNLFRKELRRRVREALEQMKAEDREVLVLRYLEQLDAKEIGAIVGISEDAVNMRHLRALKRLRGLLREALEMSDVSDSRSHLHEKDEVEQDFANLVEEITQKVQGGQRVDVDSYVRKYPEHGEQLRELFPAMRVLADLAASVSGPDSTTMGMPRDAVSKMGVLGDFRILREVGRGGMGVVYEAEQISLGRRVALKVLPFAAILDPRHLQRFQNEARAAASLKHPHIVSVYSVGCERGVHYYAMEYVDGKTLAQVISELQDSAQPSGSITDLLAHKAPSDEDAKPVGNDPTVDLAGPSQAKADTGREVQAGVSTRPTMRTAEFFQTVATLGIQAAEALEHAHQMGIVHRDIKPSNLLVEFLLPSPSGRGAGGEGGRTRRAAVGEGLHLWITDFGLAITHTDPALTMTGDILGTLRYMSPEQAGGKSRVTDHRTDIYSLGVTLYELLTLRPPFPGDDRQSVLRQIADDDPPSPHRLNRAIPKDLETVVLKATAKEPQQRYATAQQMADDLKRFLADKPIQARPPTLANRAAKWARRHRPVVWSAAILLFTATVAIGGLAWNGYRQSVQLASDVGEHLAAAGAFLQSADYPTADRELADARGHLETADYGEGPLAEEVDRLSEELSAKHQAIAQFDEFQRLRRRIHSEMYAVDRAILDQAQEHCRTALDLYQAMESNSWKQQPGFQHLSPERQATLEEGVVELLFVWARLELGKSDGQPPAELQAGHRRAADAFSRIQTFQKPIPALYLWIADSWDAVGEKKAATESRAKAEAIRPSTAMDYFLLGEHHAQHGRHDQAVASYWQALAQQPDHFLSLLAAGVALGELKKHESAEAMLTGAIAMNPQTVLGYVKRGASRLEQRKLLLAEADFKQAKKLDPNLARVFLDRVWGDWAVGDFDKAVANCTEAIRLDPNFTLAYCLRAQALANLGDLDRALADCNEAIRTGPHPAGYHWRVIIYQRKGQHDKALAESNDNIRRYPKDPAAYYLRGSIYQSLREWDKAMADYDRSIRVDPSEEDGYRYRAGLHKERGDFDKALADYDVAVRVARRNRPCVYCARAAFHNDRGEFDKAIADFNEAIRLSPKSPLGYEGRARTHLAMGERDKALADFNEAIRLGPQFLGGYVARADFYASKGEFDKAAADYDRAAELPGMNSYGYKRRGLAHFQLKHYDKALESIAKAVELKPGDGSNLWWIPPVQVAKCPDERLRKGLLELADKTIQLTKGSAEAYAARAVLYDAFGRQNAAIADFDKAVELGPEQANLWYRRALARLGRGQADQYRKDCAEMLQRFGQTTKPDDANWVAWTCALAPDATKEWPKAVALAEKAAKSNPKSPQYQDTLGAILYRAGRFDESLQRLTEADRLAQQSGGSGMSSPAYTWFFLAMAHQRLGHREEATKWLDKAVAWTEKTIREADRGTEYLPWNRRLTLKLLREEAEALLRIEKKPPAGKEKTGKKP